MENVFHRFFYFTENLFLPLLKCYLIRNQLSSSPFAHSVVAHLILLHFLGNLVGPCRHLGRNQSDQPVQTFPTLTPKQIGHPCESRQRTERQLGPSALGSQYPRRKVQRGPDLYDKNIRKILKSFDKSWQREINLLCETWG